MGGFVSSAFGAYHVLDTVYELGVTGMVGVMLAAVCFLYVKNNHVYTKVIAL